MIESRYLHTLKVSSSKYLGITKKKNSKFTLENPGRFHLSQVIKVNITSKIY